MGACGVSVERARLVPNHGGGADSLTKYVDRLASSGCGQRAPPPPVLLAVGPFRPFSAHLALSSSRPCFLFFSCLFRPRLSFSGGAREKGGRGGEGTTVCCLLPGALSLVSRTLIVTHTPPRENHLRLRLRPEPRA